MSMRLKIKRPGGGQERYELEQKPVTIGRSPDADIVLSDERSSRLHCGIRFLDDEYFLRDLKSKNGTFLNEERVEMARLTPGDRIRIGSVVMTVEGDESPPGAGSDSVFDQVEEEMEHGKGYSTILREIVDDSEQPRPGQG